MAIDFTLKNQYNIDDLVRIVALLRSPGGCPWDKEQTHQSIRKNFIEETYEAVEAIDTGDSGLLREELGDVLLQVVFHSQMEAERNVFQFEDVVDEVCHKLIVRHPHIFADVKADDTEQVLKNWEEIKKKQKGFTSQSQSLMNVSAALPALMRSTKVQQRAAKAGLDFENLQQALDSLKGEIAELEAAVWKRDSGNVREEVGDILFAAVNVSRFVRCDAEESLTVSCNKFVERFRLVEQMAAQEGRDLKEIPLRELDVLWEKAKQNLQKQKNLCDGISK